MKELKEKLARASKFNKCRLTPIIDETVLISNGRMTVTDLEFEYSFKTDITGTGVFNLKELTPFLLNPKAKFTIDESTEMMIIDIAGTQVKLKGYNPIDFPVIISRDELEIKPEGCKCLGDIFINDELKSMVKYLSNPKDDFAQAKAYFGIINNVVHATDANILCWKEKPDVNFNLNTDIYLPREICFLEKNLYLVYQKDKHIIIIRRDEMLCFKKYIQENKEGKEIMIQYQDFIPKDFDNCFLVNTQELIQHIQNALLCANKNTRMIMFGQETIESQDLDESKEYVGKITRRGQQGEPITLWFDGLLLLKVIDPKQHITRFQFKGYDYPAKVNSNHIIMPKIMSV